MPNQPKSLYKFALLLLLGLITACARPSQQLPTATLPSEETALISPTSIVEVITTSPPATPNPAPTEIHGQDTQYSLEAILDYSSHVLNVSENITFTNPYTDTLSNLILMVEPNRYKDVFNLERLLWQDGTPVADFRLEGNQLGFPLRQPLKTSEQVGLRIAFHLNLPSPVPSPFTRPVPFGYTSRQTNLVDWYPFIPPYSAGQGWLAHPPGYYGEHLAYDQADFDVSIQIKGVPASPSASTQTPVTTGNLVIAASSPDLHEGDRLIYKHGDARNFAWSVSPAYVVSTRSVGDVTIYGYAFPLHEAAGEAALETTAQALELFSELFHPYQHQTLSVVEADFLDGMEYDGLYFLSNGFFNLYSGKPDDYLVAIAAHETCHQWFYGLVGNDQAIDPWLDEAFCTYAERLYYERYAPAALDWWWAYRINYYSPHGRVGGSVYSYTYTSDAYRAYRDAVYLNGAVFLEELRKQLGDRTFFDFLKAYVNLNAGRLATSRDFFDLLRSYTGTNLEPLLQRFFTDQ